jgi:hypothetical protein
MISKCSHESYSLYRPKYAFIHSIFIFHFFLNTWITILNFVLLIFNKNMKYVAFFVFSLLQLIVTVFREKKISKKSSATKINKHTVRFANTWHFFILCKSLFTFACVINTSCIRNIVACHTLCFTVRS